MVEIATKPSSTVEKDPLLMMMCPYEQMNLNRKLLQIFILFNYFFTLFFINCNQTNSIQTEGKK